MTEEITLDARRPLALPLAALAGVIALWALLFVVIPPWQQEFPLNDDWVFARGAFAFARGEGIHYWHWASMPQLGQWLWAWPFIQVFGESHVALRLSTIILSLLGVVAFFDLLRQAGLSPGRATLVAACLALNPLYFELSGTFLTDVPTLAFSLVALALYGRAFTLASAHPLRAADLLLLAMVVAVLAAITRQNAIAVPLAAGLVLLRYPQLRLRPAWLVAVALPAVAAVVGHKWLKGQPDSYMLAPKKHIDLGRTVLVAFTATQYLGLTALPVLLFEFSSRCWKRPPVLAGFAFALLALAIGAGFFWFYDRPPVEAVRVWWNEHVDPPSLALFKEDSSVEDLFPYLGNMLTKWGQFGTNDTVLGERPLLLGLDVRVGLSVLGCLAGAALLVQVIRRLWAGSWRELLTIFTAAHVPILFLPNVIFDRYLIVLMPGALYLATSPEAEIVPEPGYRFTPARSLGLAMLAVLGLFSVGLLHDWLSWNSARWAVGERALANGIAAHDIEGGFEWNGWYSPHPVFARCREEHKGLMLWLTYCMYAHISGRYALSFSVPEGTRVVDREPYDLWLIPGRREFYLIEEQVPHSGGP
jgi:hypothetical protein